MSNNTEFYDGWDYGAPVSQRWDPNSGDGLGYITGRYGTGKAVRLGTFSVNQLFLLAAGAGGFGRGLISQSVSKTLGVAAYFESFSGGMAVIEFMDGTSVQINLKIDSTGHLFVSRGGSSTLATATSPLLLNTWYIIEFTATINSSTGSFAVALNTSTVLLSGSGVNTQATGNAWIDGVHLTGSWDADDLYIRNDTTRLGEVRCIADEPNADGDSSQWTPDSGSTHWNRVNASDGDASYVSDSTVNDLDLYKYPSFASGGGTVVAVQVVACLRKDDAGTRSVKLEIKSGGTVYDQSSTGGLTSSYQYFAALEENDPATSAPWTDSNISAVQLGVTVES